MKFSAAIAVAIVVLGAAPAHADKPYVNAPVPRRFDSTTNCYLQCLSPALVRTTTPTFSVDISGAPGGTLYTSFEVRTAPSTKATVLASTQLGPVVEPTSMQWTVPAGVLGPQTPYFWRARSMNEGGKFGPWTTWQEFSIDTTAPDLPTVSSLEYPENQWGAEVGTEGTFTFSSNAPDVAKFEYWVDNGPHTLIDPKSTTQIKYTPVTDMTHQMYVKAIDAAGNVAGVKHYTFQVRSVPQRYSHWTLDVNTDDTGNLGAPGIIEGDVTFDAGHLADAAVFNGGRIATTATLLDTTQSFTVMAWVNPSAGAQTVAGQEGMRLYSDGTAWCAQLGETNMCTSTVVTDQWVHVAMRFNDLTGQLSVFVMGDPDSCGGERSDIAAGGAASTGPFVIGSSWLGSIDDVWAYQNPLSAEDICMQAIQ